MHSSLSHNSSYAASMCIYIFIHAYKYCFILTDDKEVAYCSAFRDGIPLNHLGSTGVECQSQSFLGLTVHGT